MLVPFVVDADSLAPDPQWAPSTLRACHNDLLDMWNRFGLLVHDGASLEQSRLRQAVERLPSKQRDQWVRMLKHAPPVACATWNGQVVPAGAALLCSVASLALVDDTRAEVEFEIDEESDEVRFSPSTDRHLVVSRLQAAAHASVVEEAVLGSGVEHRGG